MSSLFRKLYTAVKEEWKYMLFYPVYLLSFFLLEQLGNGRSYHIIHCAVDDMITFNGIWVFPYYLWHAIIIFLIIYLLLTDRNAFHKMTLFFAMTTVMVFVIFLIYPSMQELRPALENDGGFVNWACRITYSCDTPTNICPSMHVVGCAGILIGIWNTRPFNKTLWRIAGILTCLLIVMSTLFLRQHSFMDLICAVPVIGAGLLTLSDMKLPQLACSALFGDVIVLGILYRDQLTAERIRDLSPSAVLLAICFILLLFAAKSMSVVLPSAPLFIASGMLFDLPVAIIINIAGAAIMVSLPYLLGKFTGSGLIAEMRESKKYSALRLLDKVRNKGEFMYAFYLRSFKLLNYDLGSSYCGAIEMKYLPYVGGSLLGILPEIIIYPLIGNGIFSDNDLPMIIGIVIEILLTVISAAAVCHLSNPTKISGFITGIRKGLPPRIRARRSRSVTAFKNWSFRL